MQDVFNKGQKWYEPNRRRYYKEVELFSCFVETTSNFDLYVCKYIIICAYISLKMYMK